MTNNFDAVKNSNILHITQGCDFSATISIKDASAAALDLTGYTVVAKLKNISNGQIESITTAITDTVGGVVTISLDEQGTAALTASSSIQYVYGIKLVSASGDTLPEIQGGCFVQEGITI